MSRAPLVNSSQRKWNRREGGGGQTVTRGGEKERAPRRTGVTERRRITAIIKAEDEVTTGNMAPL